MSPTGRTGLLVRTIDQVYGTKGWHGTTLRGALRGLRVEEALWKPTTQRHGIWELLLHAAYWKYIVTRRLTGDASLRFPRSPSNWPAVPEPASAAALRGDVALLRDEHERLRNAVLRFPASRLDDRAPESRWTYAEHIHGVAAHDAYHTGQIQLLKRLYRETR